MRLSGAIRLSSAAAMVMMLGVGCSGERIVNTGEPPAATPVTTSRTSPPPASSLHLVDAFDYVAHPQGEAVYYFTSPSGRWACAIVPRVKAGCQAATGWASGMGIADEPESVPDAAGEPTAPNVLVVEREGDARFVALEEPEILLDSANVLEFNRILAAAGFRCNVQPSGVSCLSEFSGKGFAFSTEGFTPHYNYVPANAP